MNQSLNSMGSKVVNQVIGEVGLGEGFVGFHGWLRTLNCIWDFDYLIAKLGMSQGCVFFTV